MPRRNGFTLIEVLTILVITALLASAVTVSVAHTARQIRAEDVAGQIAAWDHLAREHARRFAKPTLLLFDLQQNELRVTPGSPGTPGPGSNPGTDDAGVLPTCSLPSNCRIQAVVTKEQMLAGEIPGVASGASGASGGGVVGLPCSEQGLTPSYAVHLNGGADVSQWLIFAGLTGQVVQVHDDQEVAHIMGLMQTAGPNAR